MLNLCLSFLGVLTWVSYASASAADCIGVCPPNYPDDDVILLAHEDCGKYCSCVYGHPVEMVCPTGLHFSVEDRTCTFPALAQCHPNYTTTATPPPTTSTKQEPKPTTAKPWPPEKPLNREEPESFTELFTHQHPDCLGKCPLRNFKGAIVLVEHRECSKYCKCNKWMGEPKDCLPGLHFSLEFDGCVVPALAKCQRYIPPVHPTPSKPCPCPVHPKLLPNPAPEDKPKDAPGREYCVLPNHPSECLGLCPRWNDPDDVVHLPHRECTKFCKCDNGKPCLFTCPFELHFNPEEQVCDYPPAAKCTGIGRLPSPFSNATLINLL